MAHIRAIYIGCMVSNVVNIVMYLTPLLSLQQILMYKTPLYIDKDTGNPVRRQGREEVGERARKAQGEGGDNPTSPRYT